MRKILSNLLIRLYEKIRRIEVWMENTDCVYNIRGNVLDVATMLYPKGFCKHCGIPIEKCRSGSAQPPYRWFCCNCSTPIDE